MDDVWALRDKEVQHPHRQTERQQQRGGSVEWKTEPEHIHHLHRTHSARRCLGKRI